VLVIFWLEASVLKLETLVDLERLIQDEILESLTLEYKSSASLGRESRHRNELIKDVSAFANSAGGQIIYGIKENNHIPTLLDDGSSINREQIEQIVSSNIQPMIENLVIKPIKLSVENYAYVLTIPAAITRGPHQASDHKYYKRSNFQSIPMEDYETRDIFRRAKTPEVFARFYFANGTNKTDADLSHGSAHSIPIEFVIVLGNRSSEPAYYSAFSFYLDTRLTVRNHGNLLHSEVISLARRTVNRYNITRSVPSSFPLFKEMEIALLSPPFSFSVPNRFLNAGQKFAFGYEIRTPGYHTGEFGDLDLPMRQLEIIMPTQQRAHEQ
jgi:hypothetical protein